MLSNEETEVNEDADRVEKRVDMVGAVRVVSETLVQAHVL